MKPDGHFLAPMILSLLTAGCTHTQLRFDHVHQAKTLTDIHERQVLNNLAMFVVNEEAVPYFAVPGAGSAQVADMGSIGVSTLNGRGHSVLGPLSLSRNNTQSWAANPITDPAKLKRMRCAYRRAIGINDGDYGCINCCKLEREFRGDATLDCCCDCCLIRKIDFDYCNKRLVHDPCEKVGHYCGTYIRVCPESYDDLAHLVLTILDYAVNNPKGTKKSIDVEEYYYDEKGNVERIEKFSQAVDRNALPQRTVTSSDDPSATETTVVPQQRQGRQGEIIDRFEDTSRRTEPNPLFILEQQQIRNQALFPQFR